MKEKHVVNPLVIYKEKNITTTWMQLSVLTGVSIQGLILICKMDKVRALNMRIGTIKKLQDTIKVDMLKFINGKK